MSSTPRRTIICNYRVRTWSTWSVVMQMVSISPPKRLFSISLTLLETNDPIQVGRFDERQVRLYSSKQCPPVVLSTLHSQLQRETRRRFIVQTMSESSVERQLTQSNSNSNSNRSNETKQGMLRSSRIMDGNNGDRQQDCTGNIADQLFCLLDSISTVSRPGKIKESDIPKLRFPSLSSR